MDVELQINNSASPNARFVSWAPSPCRIRVTNPAGAPIAHRQSENPRPYRRLAAASSCSGAAPRGRFPAA